MNDLIENQDLVFVIETNSIDKSHLELAKQLQTRLRYYTEPFQEIDNELRKYLMETLGDKYTRYMQFLNNESPLICSDALLEYRKVFNKVSVSIKDQSTELVGIREKCNDKYYIENVVHEALMSAPNSLTIIERNISKIFTLDINNVIEIEIVREYESSNQSESSKKRYAVSKIVYEIDGNIFGIDSQSYYKLKRSEDKTLQNTYQITDYISHRLGYCPAFFNFEQALMYDSYLLRTTPFLSALSLFPMFTEHQTGRSYLESYSKYPIIKKRKSVCDYQSGNSRCNGHGKLMYLDGDSWQLSHHDCPNKNSHVTLIGAGTTFEIPIPEDGQTDLWNSIEIVSPNIESLNFNKERTEEFINMLSYYLVGGNAKSNMALNELQTQSLFERKKAILGSISDNYERLHYNILRTALLLEFGTIDKISGNLALPISYTISVSYAKEYYLQTTETLYKELEAAKKAGLPSSYLNKLVKEIVQVKYGNSYGEFENLFDLLTENGKINVPLYLNVNEISLLVKEGLITKEFAQKLLSLPITEIQQEPQQTF